MPNVTRRSFISTVPGLGLAAAAGGLGVSFARADDKPRSEPGGRPGYPRQAVDLVRGIVGASHFDRDQVYRLLRQHPALANATWDWGFGDWETALGAAAHTGRREIAELLIEHGARVDIFAATMLGYTDTVKGLVAARPGIQRTLGPHGITLLSHAKAGGEGASETLAYLEGLGDANPAPITKPISVEAQKRLVGRYEANDGSGDWMDVRYEKERLVICVNDQTPRVLFHSGDNAFFPQGVPGVRIAFSEESDAAALTITDNDIVVSASRKAG